MWSWPRVIVVLSVALVGLGCIALGQATIGAIIVTNAASIALGIALPPVK